MKIRLFSKTAIGKWAAILTLLFIVLMAIKLSALATFIKLPLPTPLLATIGLIGFITGAIAVFKNKDRALLTFLSLLVGLIIIFWAAAEIIFPH